MVWIDNVWYWAPSDGGTLVNTGIGSIELEGLYGTGGIRGTNGSANFTASTGFGVFNISGTGDLDRLGKVSNGRISDINLQLDLNLILSSDVRVGLELIVGYSEDGPYADLTIGGFTQRVNIETDGLQNIYDAIGWTLSEDLEGKIADHFSNLSEMKEIFEETSSDSIDGAFQDLYNVAATQKNAGQGGAPQEGSGWPQQFECFLAGTSILLANRGSKATEEVFVGDMVLSYDVGGQLVPGRVSRTFRNDVAHLLDVHGLKVTPGHVTLCGDGLFAGKHVPIIDILLSDGALVKDDGSLVRMAINEPVGSVEDQIVKLAYAVTSVDVQSGNLQTGEIRVGTLLFDKDGEAVSILDCIRAEGMSFDPKTGLVCRDGQSPESLYVYGPLPRPEDYILRRSRETLEGILADGEWEGAPSELIAQRLRRTASAPLN